jgi:hypothetical protein
MAVSGCNRWESVANAAKIAVFASHTARSLTGKRDTLMRCCTSLIGRKMSVFGFAEFPVPRAGKFPASLCFK